MGKGKRNYRQGKFYPKNPSKYLGKEIPFCRSSWEFSFCSYLDNNPQVDKWGSECFSIKYYDPVKNKVRSYFIDFYFRKTDGTQYIVEVKPSKETKPPRKGKNKSKKTLLYEHNTWQTNNAKWKSAEKFCKERGMFFKIITEKQLFG